MNDVDGERFILNNKNIVCGCVGICTCETRRLTTNKQIDFVTDEIKNQKQIIDKKFDDVGVTMGDLSKNLEQVHDTFDEKLDRTDENYGSKINDVKSMIKSNQ